VKIEPPRADRPNMDGGALCERLRRARGACGVELSALSRRTGIRLHHLQAIEDGRFADLPPGLYARAAVRGFADACGLDAAAVLAECEPLLPSVPDPIDALARKCGVAPSSTNGPGHSDSPARALARRFAGTLGSPSSAPSPTDERSASEGNLRTLAGASVDAAVVGVLLIGLVVVAAAVVRVPIVALRAAPVPLALVGVVLGGSYFLWFGGLVGATLGRVVLRAGSHVGARERLTLRTIAERALTSATEDARGIVQLGFRAGRRTVRPDAPSRTAPPPAPALWRLRPRDHAPGLWSPGNRPGIVPPPTPHRPRG
jgi:hypothetical protein